VGTTFRGSAVGASRKNGAPAEDRSAGFFKPRAELVRTNADSRVELVLRLRPDLIQLGVQPPQFCVELEQARAMCRDPLIRRHAGVSLSATRLQANAGRRRLCPWDPSPSTQDQC